jgi:hypothetical protein
MGLISHFELAKEKTVFLTISIKKPILMILLGFQSKETLAINQG